MQIFKNYISNGPMVLYALPNDKTNNVIYTTTEHTDQPS